VLSYEPRRSQWRRYAAPGLLSPRGVLALSGTGFVGYASGQLSRIAREREPYVLGEPSSLGNAQGRPFETTALAGDGLGQVWAISAQGGPGGVGLATRVDPDGLRVTAQVPVGRGPRGGGDLSGLASGGEFARAGTASHVFGGCGREGRQTDGSSQALTQWKRLRVAAVSGAGAKLLISVRRADSEPQLEAATFQRLGELPGVQPVFPLALESGGVLEVQLALQSAPAIGAPRVSRVGVEWDCPGPD
jgi:hypothetical protein